mmetsp:Transcript_6580/g.6812  ORF Transcript_6580/g.6812 Transcript_6580/m.6812 type:complete len:118 (+) Transcript_6580:411-764(+)
MGYEFDRDMHLVKKGTVYTAATPTVVTESKHEETRIVLVEDMVAAVRANDDDKNLKLCTTQIDVITHEIQILSTQLADWSEMAECVERKNAIEEYIQRHHLDHVYANPNFSETERAI